MREHKPGRILGYAEILQKGTKTPLRLASARRPTKEASWLCCYSNGAGRGELGVSGRSLCRFHFLAKIVAGALGQPLSK